jgi:Ca-activated chloride channel family protein
MLRLAHPWALLILVAGLGALLVYLRARRASLLPPALRPPALRYSDVRLTGQGKRTWRARLRVLPDLLRLIAWAVLVFALARPQMGEAREVLRGRGLDIVLALDISSSMGALDFQPDNRLAVAKQVIGDFITRREFDRIGLVVFARDAFHRAPLTLDYDVLENLLDGVQLVADITDAAGVPLLLDGTAIGDGLLSAGAMLRASDAPSKVVILLTDGENNAGPDPLLVAEAAAALGIRVYTVGMGRTGEIPVPDQDGTIVYIQSELNEETLQRIAALTGGAYFRAEDSAGLAATYAEIDRLERAPVERRVYIPWQDIGWPLVWLALGLLLGERVLRLTLFQAVP